MEFAHLLLAFFLCVYAGNAAPPDLNLNGWIKPSKEGHAYEGSGFAANNESRDEPISDLSLLNSMKFSRILSAELTCSRKLQNKDKYPNCCSSVVSIFEIEKMCNHQLKIEERFLNESSPEIERELLEIKQYYDYHCNDTEYQFLLSRNITLDDIYNCMRYNGIITRDSSNNSTQSLEDIQPESGESTAEQQRALQLYSWMNHFNIPKISSSTILSQSRYSEGAFLHTGTGQNCSPLLTLIFVRVCNSICNSNHDSSSGRSSIPMFCLRDCQPFAKFACLRGCRTFGCSVDIYTCMELMCQ